MGSKRCVFNITKTFIQQSYRVFVFELTQVLVPTTIGISNRIGRVSTGSRTLSSPSETTIIRCRLILILSTKNTELHPDFVVKELMINFQATSKIFIIGL